VGPARAGRLGDAEAALGDLAVQEVPLPSDAAPARASLRAHTSLTLPDCCVLLTAERSGAAVATFDLRLASAARARGLAVLPSG
jgi:predicted nucleic acid-binding protein